MLYWCVSCKNYIRITFNQMDKMKTRDYYYDIFYSY